MRFFRFRPSIEELVNNRDVVALLKRLKGSEYEVFLQFPDEAWDQAYDWWQESAEDRGADRVMELMLLATELTDAGIGYAGTRAVTPWEWQSRAAEDFGSHKACKEATCPVCENYLSDSPVEGERGHYRQCQGCHRLYHRNCAAGMRSCQLCGGASWEWRVSR